MANRDSRLIGRSRVVRYKDLTECVCGESIHKIALPADADPRGQEYLWVHAHDNSLHCYEDDADCVAEPLGKRD